MFHPVDFSRCTHSFYQDHLHAAKNLVETFKEPVCLVPVELPQVRPARGHRIFSVEKSRQSSNFDLTYCRLKL
jgi:hypothetical protein